MDDKFLGLVGAQVNESRTANAAPREPILVAEAKTVASYKAWASNDKDFWGTASTYTSLPSGLYRFASSHEIGIYLSKMENKTDSLLTFPDSDSEAIVKEIVQFKDVHEEFTSRGFLHKRGILLWGPPGSGKTSTIQLLIRLIVERYNGIAIFVDHPGIASQGFQMVRKIEPTRQIIAIMEDFDSLVRRYDENEFLAMLDGESQIDNVVFVATTNYPERLDKRFVDRPSRFDTIKYIGMPNAEARRTYLVNKEKVWDADELDHFVEISDGFSVAHLRELIILTKCFKRPLEESAAKLRKSIDLQPDSSRSPDAPKFGFAAH